MLEEGIVKLVQSDPAVSALCPIGGFLKQLPDGQALPSWAYTIVSNVDSYCLDGTHGNVKLRLQIDCFADTPAQTIRFARAINNVLSGYHGTLSDIDQTKVFGCFRSDIKDEFNDATREGWRMLEYEIDFSDTPLGA